MTATPADEAPQVRVIAMPADANPAGDIFGGWLMAHMDQAGASVALRRARGRVATVAVEAMTFHLPVRVGDEVRVRFDARCNDAAVLSRLETHPPAGLYGAPAVRQKAIIRNPETLKKLSA